MKKVKLFIPLLTLFSAVIFSSCTKEATNPVTRSISVPGFDKIEAGDDHEIVITQSATFSIQARGDAGDITDLRTVVTNGVLKIDYPNYRNNRKRVHIYISMPVLKLANFNGASYGSVNGFTLNDNFKISLTGVAKFTFVVNAFQFDVNLSGTSALTVYGTASKVTADVSGQAQYFGYGISNTTTAFVWASGQAKAYVYTTNQLNAEAGGQAKIYFKGNPAEKFLTTTGQASIIAQ